MNPATNFPKWKHHINPEHGEIRSTLVANAEVEAELGSEWVDDALSLDPNAVPLPCELTPAGTVVHYGLQPDANGNFAYGPRPQVAGINGAVVMREV